MNLVPYERPRGSVHDLNHLADLGTGRCRILCVSERTLYILFNYAATDIGMSARFAEELLEDGYIPISDESPLADLHRDVVDNFRLEIEDMTCDIQTGLESVAAAIQELAAANRGGGGSGSCGNGGYIGPCISDLTNEELNGPDESEQGNPAIDPPPEGFDSWEDYFEYKCQAAHYIHQFLVNLCTVTSGLAGLQLISAIVTPIIAGAAGMLPAAFTPAGFAIFIGGIVAIGVISTLAIVEVQQIRSYLVANDRDIICALYNSQNTVTAVTVVTGAFEDAIQAIVWPEALLPVSAQLNNLLSLIFAQVATNGTVESLFKLFADVQFATASCDDCNGGLPYAQTAQGSPYNVLTVGDQITAYDDSPAYGYQAENSGIRVDLEFHVDGGYTGLWQWSAEYSIAATYPETAVVQLEYWTGSSWANVPGGTWTFPIPDDQWTQIGASDIDLDFSDATQYRLHCQPQGANQFGWYRKIDLRPQ